MSKEAVLKTLMGLGLSRLDSEIFIFLSKKGPQLGSEMSKALKTQKQPLYRSLKFLQGKGIVTATLEHPARFTAISFEEVVDIFVRTKMAEAQSIQENKNEILANWQAISLGESIDSAAKFNLIEGRGPIYAKILQMIQQAQSQLSTITTVSGLLRADQFGLFEAGFSHKMKNKIRFRAITGLSEENVVVAQKLVKELADAKIRFEGRTPEIDLKLPQMVMRDDDEILFFISSQMNNLDTSPEDACLWTNCKSLVQAFSTMFEGLWGSATDIGEKISAMKTYKTSSKTQIIANAEAARERYNEVIEKAEKEVTLITSSIGLNEISSDTSLLNSWVQKNIAVKIMAPITSENIDAAQELSEQYEVRHVPLGYLETLIVDGKHLFQFKNSPKEQQEKAFKPLFENTFYTNDLKYLEKTKTMVSDIWRSTQPLSSVTLNPATWRNTPSGDLGFENVHVKVLKKMYATNITNENVRPSEKFSEKDALNRLVNSQMSQEADGQNVVVAYGTIAQAIVHPPEFLGLPTMLFHVYHLEKQSTYGTEDAIAIHLWQDTPMGYAFVPASVITDNSETVSFWQRLSAATPASENVNVVKKNEVQIQLQRNVLFAGWTVPIQLPQGIIPPSGLLIEGCTEAKASAYSFVIPSGYKLKAQQSVCDAFVTYLHPSSKYSGPGTDGGLAVDVKVEYHPPGQ